MSEQVRSVIPSPQVTVATIQETTQTISLLQEMVKDVLIRDVDYGRIPGTPQDSLWDPGASQIIGSFNCYCGQRRILKLEDTEEKIVVCVEVPIISRATQREVGSGIGAASTLETKYKYRWVDDPKQWGYDDAAIKTFKTKQGRGGKGDYATLYRIPNPEHSELINTIIKMASKRAEVDAAEGLPGVASVLRQMFSGKAFRKGEPPGKDEYSGPRWQRFWGEVTRLGYTDKEAHTKLRVASMHDWLAQGRSLDEALAILRSNENPEQKANAETSEVSPQETVDAGTGEIIAGKDDFEETFDGSEREAGTGPTESPGSVKPKRDPKSIKTITELLHACFEDFKLQPQDVYKELGYSSAQDISKKPADCYSEIAAVRQQQ